jgi:hypothetical protein
MPNDEFDLDALLKEADATLDEFPYDAASWHYESDEYPKDLPPDAAFTHLGIYLGWAIERDLISDALKERCADAIEKIRKRKLMPSEAFRICCVDEFTRDHLNDRGNAFTKKYYLPGWKYYYHEDFHTLSGNEISGFYMPDTWENYERIKAAIDKRYQEWMKEKGGK